MAKRPTLAEYDDRATLDCERLLVTLLAGFGPWKDSVYLIGGLVPRYLVPQRPPQVPAHAGTIDVDVVFDLQIVGQTEAYRTLEQNLKTMGFERGTNDSGARVSWRWEVRTEQKNLVMVEFLVDDPARSNERAMELKTDTGISVLNIPHASMVFDHYLVREIRAELLTEGGVQIEAIRHADIVSFTCLKALAMLHRRADGNPIYDANGKFLKGPNYWKPEPDIRERLERRMRMWACAPIKRIEGAIGPHGDAAMPSCGPIEGSP